MINKEAWLGAISGGVTGGALTHSLLPKKLSVTEKLLYSLGGTAGGAVLGEAADSLYRKTDTFGRSFSEAHPTAAGGVLGTALGGAMGYAGGAVTGAEMPATKAILTSLGAVIGGTVGASAGSSMYQPEGEQAIADHLKQVKGNPSDKTYRNWAQARERIGETARDEITGDTHAGPVVTSWAKNPGMGIGVGGLLGVGGLIGATGGIAQKNKGVPKEKVNNLSFWKRYGKPGVIWGSIGSVVGGTAQGLLSGSASGEKFKDALKVNK